ncbi:MAG: SH3 domain-containing protein [Anaerolineales bacterium]
MPSSSQTKYSPGYDLFKLIVAVVLTVILFFLLLRNRPRGGGELSAVNHGTPTPANVVKTVTLPSTEVVVSFTSTATLLPSVTATILPTATPTEIPPTETATLIPETNACPSQPSRVNIGDSVQVLLRLNFRTGPGLNYPVILTNSPNTKMQIIGGPICTTKDTPEGPRAYRWWNVRREEDGLEGWSAEAPLINSNYFIEPAQ